MGLNVGSVNHDESLLKVIGKGNKERMIKRLNKSQRKNLELKIEHAYLTTKEELEFYEPFSRLSKSKSEDLGNHHDHSFSYDDEVQDFELDVPLGHQHLHK